MAESSETKNVYIRVQFEGDERIERGMQSITGSVLKANLASQAITAGLRKVAEGFKNVLEAGSNMARLEIATKRLAENMGFGADQVRAWKEELEASNTTGSRALGIINAVMRSGLVPMLDTLERINPATGEVTKGFNAFALTAKDLGAAVGVDSGQAIETLTMAIVKQRDELLQSLGVNLNLVQVYREFASTLGKTTNELTNTERAQAILNAVMEEGAKVAGTYEDVYQTSAKNISSIRDASRAAAEELGAGLEPAMYAVTSAVLKAVKAIRDFITENREKIQTIAISISNVVKAFIGWISKNKETILTILKIIGIVTAFIVTLKVAAVVVGVVTGAVIALKAAVLALAAGLTVAQVAAGALAIVLFALAALVGISLFQELQNTFKGLNSIGDSAKEAGKGMSGFGNAATKAGKSASKALSETQKNIEKIQDQIQEENERFNEQLAEIVDRRTEQIRQNKKALEEEKRAYEDVMKAMEQRHTSELTRMKQLNKLRMDNLKRQLTDEQAKGDEANEEKIASLKDSINEEKTLSEERLADLQEQQQKEKDEEKMAYDERTQALMNKIAEDEAMLQRHAGLIKTINRDIIKDEIQKLKESHEARLKELNDQLQKEKQKYNEGAGNFGSSIDGMGLDWDSLMENINSSEIDFNDMIKPIDWNKVLKRIKANFKSVLDTVIAYTALAIVGLASATMITLRKALLKIPVIGLQLANLIAPESGIKQMDAVLLSIAKDLKHFQTGTLNAPGGLALVGERGPELVDIPRGSKVFPARDTGQMLGNTYNISINSPIYGIDNLRQAITDVFDSLSANQNRYARYNLV